MLCYNCCWHGVVPVGDCASTEAKNPLQKRAPPYWAPMGPHQPKSGRESVEFKSVRLPSHYEYYVAQIRPPRSASSHRPLRSLVRSDFFVPRARSTIAHTRSFAIIGSSLWNALPFTLRATFLSGS